LRASLDSWLQLGRAYQAANRPDLARAAYDRALAIDPALQRAIAGRVDVELQSKGTAAAAALAHSLLGAAADGAVALSCGEALTRDRRYAAAVIFYQIAGEHHAGAASLQGLALAKLRLDDRSGLSRQLSDWLAKNPDSLELRALLAETLMRDHDWREAAHQWSLVLAKQPGNAMAANNLAWLYGKLQDPRALDYAEKALLAAPDQPQIKDTYGVLLLASGQRGRAGELLRQAMQAAPDNPEVSFHFAQYLAEGDREAARKLLQTLIERNIAFDEADQARQLYQRLSNGG
jgi:Tfp pilus assembly protein PilF